MRRRRLTALAATLIIAACGREPRLDAGEMALAAAASDSLDVALADSISPGNGFVVGQAGGQSFSACGDHFDSHGWQSFGSSIVELELPAGFSSAGQTNRSVEWRGPGGSVRAWLQTGGTHSGVFGTITSECDIFISGSPAHVDLVSGNYARSVHAYIQVRDAPAIGMEATAQTAELQGQLLHAIRTARVSSAWGRGQ